MLVSYGGALRQVPDYEHVAVEQVATHPCGALVAQQFFETTTIPGFGADHVPVAAVQARSTKGQSMATQRQV